MSYIRVIPRDFFNEAKLLKCYGQLALAVLDGMTPRGMNIVLEESGQPFQIELLDDGYLYVSNYATSINGRDVTFKTAYNSKRNYPLYCTHPDSLEDVEVFDDTGKFTTDFIESFSQFI